MKLALIALVAPALVAWLATALLARSPVARRLVDRPNERSLHASPIPRVGGIAVMIAALPYAAWIADGELRVVIACAAALALVSLADDVRSLPVVVRLAAHLCAAAVAALELGAAAAILWLVAFAIAWMTNLFNFMDGADGLAGGMAVTGFAAYAVAGHAAGEPAIALCSLTLASAAMGFLAHNFPPARVFLGDAGSIPLGFLAGALGYAGYVRGAWPVWFPLLVFSPFIVDASFTLVRRVARGARPWRAHREHCYQRLILSGCSPRKLALASYALMACAAVAALAALAAGPMLQCGILLAAVALYGLLVAAAARYLRSRDAS